MGNSKILEGAGKICDGVTRFLCSGELLRLPSRAANAWDSAASNSRILHRGRKLADGLLRSPAGERSHGVTSTLLTRLGHFLLRCSMESWGIFFVLCGGGSVTVLLFSREIPTSFGRLWLPVAAVISGIPLLQSKKSLSYALRHSWLVGGFLLGFCGLFEEELGNGEEVGERHPWIALACASVGVAINRASPYVLLVLGIAVPVLLLILRLPELLLTALAVALPFLGWTGHATAILTLLILLLEGTWLRKYCRGQRTLNGGFSVLLILLPGALFALWGFLGAGGKATLYSGLVRCVLLLGYFPTVSLLSHPTWRRRFGDALQIGGFFCALVGIVEYFFVGAELKWVDTSRFFDLGGRVCATFSNPNVLAVYLLLLLPGGASTLLAEGIPLRRRCFYGVAFAAQALCLVLTWTRGAWLGALVALLLLMLLQSRATRAWLLLGLPTALFSLPLLPGNVLRRFGSIGSMTDSSTRYRLYTWKGVLRMWRAHPWGIGPGEAAFTQIYPSYAVSGTERVMHAHHLLLQVGCELGVTGCVILLTLLLWFFLQTARGCWRYAGEQRRRMLGAACGLLGALVMGFFDHIWYHYGTFLLFWQVCACLSAACTEEPAHGGIYA